MILAGPARLVTVAPAMPQASICGGRPAHDRFHQSVYSAFPIGSLGLSCHSWRKPPHHLLAGAGSVAGRLGTAATMNAPPRILVVDDSKDSRDIIATRLRAHGYETSEAADGERGLAAVSECAPDLILLDVTMPKLDGIEVCRRLKSDRDRPFTPIIILTAKADPKDIVTGLDAGADEYLTKPINHAALVARVQSMLRLKELHDRVQAQADDLAKWNRDLEQRVREQVAEIERVGRLKRFLPPQVAHLIVSSGDESILESHSREITVLFCDLRGFTAFAEAAEPEEVLAVLREYHAALGVLIDKFEGTVERFTGDGLLVLFNDPLPCPDPPGRAVRMAIEMRHEVAKLATKWRHFGYELGFGIGIAHGHATLGCIGFEGRFQYSVTGRVANLASRLCAEAAHDEILVDTNVNTAIENLADVEARGELSLKGFSRPVKAFSIRGLNTRP
jgi:adenylate cyclase